MAGAAIPSPARGHRARWTRLVVIAAVAVPALLWGLFNMDDAWWPDFSVFHAAAQAALEDPAIVYDGERLSARQAELGFTGWRPWAYPPTALLPLLPFGALPLLPAYLFFTTLTASLFIWAARPIAGRAWPLVILSTPFLSAFENGQMTFLVGALVIAGVVRLPGLAGGVLLGIAAALKPQLLVLAPLAMLASGATRALLASIAAGAAVVLASLALGPTLWLDWYAAAPEFLDRVRDSFLSRLSVSPSAYLSYHGIPTWPLWLTLYPAAVAAVVGAFRFSDDRRLQLVALVGGALWLSPYAMHYDMLVLAPVAAFLAMTGDLKRRLLAIAALVTGGYTAPLVAFLFIGAHMLEALGHLPLLDHVHGHEKTPGAGWQRRFFVKTRGWWS